jgi:hypothetical protein
MTRIERPKKHLELGPNVHNHFSVVRGDIMKFHDKLNLVLSMQNIPNNKLAKAISVDPSLISRWRNGTRIPANHCGYIEVISHYIATHATDRQSLCELLTLTEGNCDNCPEIISEKLCLWFNNENTESGMMVSKFIERLHFAKEATIPNLPIYALPEEPTGKRLSVEVYKGNAGKREGVIRFLSAVIKSKKPCTLLLYSDESMDWMLEDPSFTEKWALLLYETIRAGHRINIVHTISRSNQELMAAIDRWMPLYATGAITPYYYPNYQESLFRRTMFIAPGIAALTSSALADTTSSEQLYYNDQQMISNLVGEFDAYLKHCRPLMRFFKEENREAFIALYDEFEAQKGDMYFLSPWPSSSELHSFVEEFINKRTESMTRHLNEYKFTTWFKLLDPAELMGDKIDELLPGITKEAYIDNVKQILNYSKQHHHFYVHLDPPPIPEDIIIMVKPEVGVIFCKIDHSPLYIAFNHHMLVGAFQSFVEEMVHASPQNKPDIIQELENWLATTNS